MNRFILAFAFLFTLALAGCDAAGPSAVEDGLQSATAPAADAAVSVRFNDVPVSTFVPCADGGAGEIVSGTADIHIVGRLTTNANGFHFGGHLNFSNFRIEGETTGIAYSGQQVQNFQLNVSANGASETTQTVSFRANGRGSAPNATFHANVHITINANGDVTATVLNVRAECD